MCGITGIVSSGANGAVKGETLRCMTQVIAHRGPDDSGEEILQDGKVGLGFRRLSIIDLSANGHQPMRDVLNRAMIVFNGEVYNYQELKRDLVAKGYRFNSHTDTEVVLNAYLEWGKECLERFNGMFAFAIWDMKALRLFIARDRFGIKPLYYARNGNYFSFASEIKSLFQVGDLSRELDPHAIWNYLTLLQIPAPETIFASVRKLPPAHAMTVEACGQTHLWRYWQPVMVEQEMPEGEIIEKIRSIFKDSIRRHLMADVPVGVFLSGGIDSSAIVAEATLLRGEPIRTFSVSFSGDDGFDESPFQRMVVDRYHPHHHEFRVTPDILAASRLLLQESDEPFAVSSAIPLYYIARSASQHVKVVLSGDGADELFGGYESRYHIAAQIQGLAKVPVALRDMVSQIAVLVPDRLTRYRGFRRLKKVLNLAGHSDDEQYLYSFGTFGAREKETILRPEILDHMDRGFGENYAWCFTQAPADPTQRYYYADIVTALADEMLTKVDRCTSMVSIEGRVPFLDRELSEFALGIPARHKYAGGVGKRILRKAVEPLLPAELLWGKKRGFNVPMDAWIKSNMRAIRTQLLDEASPGFKQIFNVKAVRRILDVHERHIARFGHHIWALLQFNEWSQLHEDDHWRIRVV